MMEKRRKTIQYKTAFPTRPGKWPRPLPKPPDTGKKPTADPGKEPPDNKSDMKMDMKSKTLAANLENLDAFQTFIFECAEASGMDVPQIQKMQLASEEALVNIFNYAYPEDTGGDVTVTCSLDGEKVFKIRLEDCGRPFDMLAKDDPDTSLSIDDRAIGGLGIFFIKQMMDSVDYRREDDKNILTLTLTVN